MKRRFSNTWLASNKRRPTLLATIILLALFWRFNNYSERWVLNQDDARDVVIARYMVETKTLPLLGPTSSAGPFSFGPMYYWIVALFYIVSGFIVNGPWIVFTLLSVFSVVLMYYAAEKIGGISMGLVTGLLTSFAPAEIAHSAMVTNPVLSGFFAFLVVFLGITAITSQSKFIHLWIGLTIGIAVNSHFQSLGLMAVPLILFGIKRQKIKERVVNLSASVLGVLISFVPLVIFDLNNKFVWSQSVIGFLIEGRNRFYLPVRWLTDLTVFWPEIFGKVVAGNALLGYVIIVLMGSIFLIKLVKKTTTITIPKEIFFVIFLLIVQVILIRYYHGPRGGIYLMFLHPMIIILTGWLIANLKRLNIYFGTLTLIILMTTALFMDINLAKSSTQTNKIQRIKDQIINQGIYEASISSYGSSRMLALPLYYLLAREGLISDNAESELLLCDNFYQKVDRCKMIGDSLTDKIAEVAGEGGYRVYRVNDLTVTERRDWGLRLMNNQNIYNEIYLNYPQSIR